MWCSALVIQEEKRGADERSKSEPNREQHELRSGHELYKGAERFSYGESLVELMIKARQEGSDSDHRRWIPGRKAQTGAESSPKAQRTTIRLHKIERQSEGRCYHEVGHDVGPHEVGVHYLEGRNEQHEHPE